MPPANLEAEENILGAALTSPDAARVVAEDVVAGAFYKPQHGHIASAISSLVAEGARSDVGTVAALLRQQGLLDDVGGPGELIGLQARHGYTGGAPKWAQLINDCYRRRRALSLTGAILEGLYDDTDVAGLVGELAEQADAHDDASSWAEVDLDPILMGEAVSCEPVFLARADGRLLLYPERVHAFNAESESGKSWLALAACVEVMG